MTALTASRPAPTEALVGYKIGYLVLADEDTVKVSGLTAGSTAPYGARAGAVCTAGGAHEGVSVLGCSCGFHIYSKRANAVAAIREYEVDRGIPVLLTVSAWGGPYGLVVEHELGWRSPRQDIVGVEYLNFCAVCLEDGRRVESDLFGDLTRDSINGVGGITPLCLGCALDSGVATFSPAEIAARLGIETVRLAPMGRTAALETIEWMEKVTSSRAFVESLGENWDWKHLTRTEIEANLGCDLLAAVLGEEGGFTGGFLRSLVLRISPAVNLELFDEITSGPASADPQTPREIFRALVHGLRADEVTEDDMLQLASWITSLNPPLKILAIRPGGDSQVHARKALTLGARGQA